MIGSCSPTALVLLRNLSHFAFILIATVALTLMKSIDEMMTRSGVYTEHPLPQPSNVLVKLCIGKAYKARKIQLCLRDKQFDCSIIV